VPAGPNRGIRRTVDRDVSSGLLNRVLGTKPRMDARRSVIFISLAAIALVTAPAFSQETPSTTASTESAGKSGGAGGLNPDMKLDDLVKQDVLVPSLSTVVNSVNRQESTVGRSPAAIFVITPDMIKRSGARSIPEALRMAPGLDLARINAHTWAISVRGFNGRFADELLVQIDRRIVYNATFGGVYWDLQDVVLADVERIEVIRGPGTTAWGSNAVNGVINIITKKAGDTQGVLVQSGGGDQERDFNAVRYGATTPGGVAWRAWGQQFNRNSGWSDSGVADAWQQQRGGFRADYMPAKEETLTLQGDISEHARRRTGSHLDSDFSVPVSRQRYGARSRRQRVVSIWARFRRRNELASSDLLRPLSVQHRGHRRNPKHL
jgi:iron complex outermembrane recepter protein